MCAYAFTFVCHALEIGVSLQIQRKVVDDWQVKTINIKGHNTGIEAIREKDQFSWLSTTRRTLAKSGKLI